MEKDTTMLDKEVKGMMPLIGMMMATRIITNILHEVILSDDRYIKYTDLEIECKGIIDQLIAEECDYFEVEE